VTRAMVGNRLCKIPGIRVDRNNFQA